jgi:vacuolar-type H+-ATPase subunit H
MTNTNVTGTAPGAGPQQGSTSSVEQAKDTTKAVAHAATNETRAVVGEAKASARNLVGDARTQLRGQADDQAQRLAGTLRTFGEQLSSMASSPQAEGTAAEMARQAADRTQHFAQRLEFGGVDGVMEDAKRLARTRPGTFLLGALGAGFLVGRIVKNVDTHALTQAAKPDSDSQDGQQFGSPAGVTAGVGSSGAISWPELEGSPTPIGTSASSTGVVATGVPLGSPATVTGDPAVGEVS